MPGDFGLGVTGVANTAEDTGCVFHNSLKDGAVCKIQCVNGYEMDVGNSTLLEFSCAKGILTSPIIQCNVKVDHVFTVTKAEKCSTCIETTSCVAILPTWLICVIVGGSVVLILIGMCCIVAKCYSVPICCCFQKKSVQGAKKEEFTKDVELAEVDTNKKVVAM